MIDWNGIDAVFLDMDGTLLDLGFDNYFWRDLVPRRYAEAQGVSVQDAKVRIADRYQRMEGTLAWYCLEYWSAELQLDLAGLKREVSGSIGMLPYAEAFLRSLKQRRVLHTVLVTNAHPSSLALKLAVTGLDAFFGAIVCSHDLGVPKESSEFWIRLNEIERYRPERTLLVDDSLAVLAAARAHGMAYTIAIRKPDSALAPRVIEDFWAIDDFREIMPP
jgi:HAD superfamily hydrolase (TIGR01509 family)